MRKFDEFLRWTWSAYVVIAAVGSAHVFWKLPPMTLEGCAMAQFRREGGIRQIYAVLNGEYPNPDY